MTAHDLPLGDDLGMGPDERGKPGLRLDRGLAERHLTISVARTVLVSRVLLLLGAVPVAGCQAIGAGAVVEQSLAKVETRVNAHEFALARINARVGTIETDLQLQIGGGGDSVTNWLSLSGAYAVSIIVLVISYRLGRWWRLRSTPAQSR